MAFQQKTETGNGVLVWVDDAVVSLSFHANRRPSKITAEFQRVAGLVGIHIKAENPSDEFHLASDSKIFLSVKQAEKMRDELNASIIKAAK